MLNAITTKIENQTLHLNGALDCNTLATVWQQKKQLSSNITDIDVSKLTRVDSSGLAFLTYCCIKYQAKLIALNPQLKTLIALYGLESIVVK